jgi:hypothetical protein
MATNAPKTLTPKMRLNSATSLCRRVKMSQQTRVGAVVVATAGLVTARSQTAENLMFAYPTPGPALALPLTIALPYAKAKPMLRQSQPKP